MASAFKVPVTFIESFAHNEMLEALSYVTSRSKKTCQHTQVHYVVCTGGMIHYKTDQSLNNKF